MSAIEGSNEKAMTHCLNSLLGIETDWFACGTGTITGL
jgi:hypothetical protein